MPSIISASNYFSATPPSNTAAGPITICGWFYITGNDGGYGSSHSGYLASIVSTTTDNDRIGILTDGSANNNQGYIIENGPSEFAGFYEISRVTASLNAWHHWAMTVATDTTISGYLDGVLQSSFTQSTSPHKFSTAYTNWGSKTWGALRIGPFLGTAQDVRFYGAVLTAQQITNVMRRRSVSVAASSSVVAWYPLAAGSGVRTVDFSGNGRTLSPVGTVTDDTSHFAPSAWR